MLVTIVDRAKMDRTYGTPAFAGVALVTVAFGNTCLVCGAPRGKSELKRFHEWGEFYEVDTWINECGHVDKYRDVLAEAAGLAAALSAAVSESG